MASNPLDFRPNQKSVRGFAGIDKVADVAYGADVGTLVSPTCYCWPPRQVTRLSGQDCCERVPSSAAF